MGADRRLDQVQVADADLVALVDQYKIGAKELLLEQLFQRAFVVTEGGIGRPLLRSERQDGREAAGQDRRRVDDHENTINRDLRSYFRPGEGLHQRLG